MFIVWGKKAVYRHLGYVADFCPVCVAKRAFSLERIGMAGHVYYITSGDGDLVGHRLHCLECHSYLNGRPERYRNVASKRVGVDALIKETFPTLTEFHEARLQIEKQVRTDLRALDANTRYDLMIEPFELLEFKVAKHFEETRLDFGGNYFMRRDILPVLAHALARLRPTESELSGMLQRLKQAKSVMGKKVRLDELQAELALVYARAPAAGATVFGSADWGDAVGLAQSGGRRPGGPLLGYERAGKVIRTTGIILTGLMALFAFGGLFDVLLGTSEFKPALAVVMAVFVALSVLPIFLGNAVLRRDDWARPAGIAFGVLMLLAVPVLTPFGAYVLWHLIRGWRKDDDQQPAFAAG